LKYILIKMMKKGVLSLALLIGACIKTSPISVDQEGVGVIRYYQNSFRSSYEVEACFETTDSLRYSVADGLEILKNFAVSIDEKGYTLIQEKESEFTRTKDGWVLCNFYSFVKK